MTRSILLTVVLAASVGCVAPADEHHEPAPTPPTTQVPGGGAHTVSCAISEKTARTQAEVLANWGQPCHTEWHGDASTASYAAERCDLGAGPSWCARTCPAGEQPIWVGREPAYRITYVGGQVTHCDPPRLTLSPPPVRAVVSRTAHEFTSLDGIASCAGGATMLFGVCDCADGGFARARFSGGGLACACASPGLTIWTACMAPMSGLVIEEQP